MNNKQLGKTELRLEKPTKQNFHLLKRNNIIIVLDSLKVAHNIGTIFRMSDAVLAKKLYICGNSITPPNYKIKKSSIGSDKWVDWEYSEKIEDVLQKLKEQNAIIVSVEVSENSIEHTQYHNYLEAHWETDKDIVIVMGREFDGVSQEALDLSDIAVHLPIYGMCNSLNVSTAASVLIFQTLDFLNLKK